MNYDMEVLKSDDLEKLIRSIDMEMINGVLSYERIKHLTLKKKLLKSELANRVILGEIT